MSKNNEATLLLRIKTAGEDLLSKTKGALGDLRTWAAAAFAALTSGAAVSAFKDAEKSSNALNQSLIQQGIYTRALSEDYRTMAADLQKKTTFDDDSIIAAQAQMQSYLGQTKITRELMQATLDLATAKKMDLVSAADIVGKSIGTNTNALKRQGVELSDNATKSEKFSQVIAGLNTKFGGQAEAAAQGLGSLDQMKNVIGDLLELVGEKFAPFVSMMAKQITQLASDVMNNKAVWETFDKTLEIVAGTVSSLKFGFLVLKDVVVGTLSTAAQALIAFVTGDFSNVKEILRTGISEMGENIKSDFEKYLSEMDAIKAIRANKEKNEEEEEVRRKQQTEERKKHIMLTAADEEKKFLEARTEKELQKLMTDQQLMKDQYLSSLNWRLFAENDHTKKLELEMEKRRYLDLKYKQAEEAASKVSARIMIAIAGDRAEEFKQTLDNMSNMQNSKNKILQVAGKAAALANITMNTADAATGAYRAMVGVPVIGPGLAVGAATATVAYGAEQAANVAGVQLAEGGIVKATPGGIHAIIGEGGRDEAVIPLEKGKALGGTVVNVVVNGPLLGDERQAREWAIFLDKEFFKLRQSNSSLAFDRGII